MQSIHILSTSFNNNLLHGRLVLHCFAKMKAKTRLFQGCRTFSTGVEKPAFCRLYPVAVTATGVTFSSDNIRYQVAGYYAFAILFFFGSALLPALSAAHQELLLLPRALRHVHLASL